MSAPKIDDGGPAYPCPEAGVQHFNDEAAYTGMTLRDYFAATAAEADIEAMKHKISDVQEVRGSQDRKELVWCRPSNWRQIARYMHADMMIEARKEKS